MFAIIKTGGKQYRVAVGDILEVERLPVEPGAKVNFREILLIDDGTKTLLGTPYLSQAMVRAELLEEFKDEKVIVFKKKRRKQYKKKRGHRQLQTRVKILEIIPNLELKEKEALQLEPVEEKMAVEVEEKSTVEAARREKVEEVKPEEKAARARKKAKPAGSKEIKEKKKKAIKPIKNQKE